MYFKITHLHFWKSIDCLGKFDMIMWNCLVVLLDEKRHCVEDYLPEIISGARKARTPRHTMHPI